MEKGKTRYSEAHAVGVIRSERLECCPKNFLDGCDEEKWKKLKNCGRGWSGLIRYYGS